MKNKPRENKRTEKIDNLGKVRGGVTKIESSKTRDQQKKSKQTRKKSNPTDNAQFQRCRKNCKDTESF
jgi:hypothetical protein